MQQDALANALEKVHISHHHAAGEKKHPPAKHSYLNGLVTMVMNKSKKNDCSAQETIIQDIKDMAIWWEAPRSLLLYVYMLYGWGEVLFFLYQKNKTKVDVYHLENVVMLGFAM